MFFFLLSPQSVSLSRSVIMPHGLTSKGIGVISCFQQCELRYKIVPTSRITLAMWCYTLYLHLQMDHLFLSDSQCSPVCCIYRINFSSIVFVTCIFFSSCNAVAAKQFVFFFQPPPQMQAPPQGSYIYETQCIDDLWLQEGTGGRICDWFMRGNSLRIGHIGSRADWLYCFTF